MGHCLEWELVTWSGARLSRWSEIRVNLSNAWDFFFDGEKFI